MFVPDQLRTQLWTLLPAVLALTAAGPRAQGDGVNCLKDWSEAAVIVRREGLATVAQLTERAHGQVTGEVLKTELCREKGRYTYHMVVRTPHGQLESHSVDARHPFAAAGKHD